MSIVFGNFLMFRLLVDGFVSVNCLTKVRIPITRK